MINLRRFDGNNRQNNNIKLLFFIGPVTHLPFNRRKLEPNCVSGRVLFKPNKKAARCPPHSFQEVIATDQTGGLCSVIEHKAL